MGEFTKKVAWSKYAEQTIEQQYLTSLQIHADRLCSDIILNSVLQVWKALKECLVQIHSITVKSPVNGLQDRHQPASQYNLLEVASHYIGSQIGGSLGTDFLFTDNIALEVAF